LIDVNGDGNIEFDEFARVFAREIDVDRLTPDAGRESDGEVDWKHKVFSQVNAAIRKLNLDMYTAFSAFDDNKDGMISRAEFSQAFENMGLALTQS
jgi:Ca2+-binding EF-hand superfamily protein